MTNVLIIISGLIVHLFNSALTSYAYAQVKTNTIEIESLHLTLPPKELFVPLPTLEEIGTISVENNFNNQEFPAEQIPNVNYNYIQDVKIRYSLPSGHDLISIFNSIVSLSMTSLNITDSKYISKTYNSIKESFKGDVEILIISSNLFARNKWEQCVKYLNSSKSLRNHKKNTSFDVTKLWWENGYLNNFIINSKNDNYTILAILAEPASVLHLSTKEIILPNKLYNIVTEGWAWNNWSKSNNLNIKSNSFFTSWINGKAKFLKNNIYATSWLSASAYSVFPLTKKHIEYNDLYLPIFIIANNNVFNKISKEMITSLTTNFGKPLSLLTAQLLDQSIQLEKEKVLLLGHTISSVVKNNNYTPPSNSMCKNIQ